MGNKVLTPLQERILGFLVKNRLPEQGYFLTGGTALAAFYFQHRLSDDLDFFTRKQESLEEDFKIQRNTLASAGFSVSVRHVSSDGMVLFVDGMKVEFHRDVPVRMAPEKTFDNLVVDSLEDISVNKVCAIAGRPMAESKDFCDLYFILKGSEYKLEYLLGRAKEKEALFDGEDGVMVFANRLLEVKKLEKLPKMLKPLSLENLRQFFMPKAEDIIRRLRPR
ncbi:MAG: nucleotidyl transferase AbiEii/AbiGii toxin family protein [Elusimicrobia bacterium]|nr:nucleotidyl transferase AbiEii/AbiGii toxin family protein [Elusimicrobiota bacterium]